MSSSQSHHAIAAPLVSGATPGALSSRRGPPPAARSGRAPGGGEAARGPRDRDPRPAEPSRRIVHRPRARGGPDHGGDARGGDRRRSRAPAASFAGPSTNSFASAPERRDDGGTGDHGPVLLGAPAHQHAAGGADRHAETLHRLRRRGPSGRWRIQALPPAGRMASSTRSPPATRERHATTRSPFALAADHGWYAGRAGALSRSGASHPGGSARAGDAATRARGRRGGATRRYLMNGTLRQGSPSAQRPRVTEVSRR